MKLLRNLLAGILILGCAQVQAQTSRRQSGTIVTGKNEVVAGAFVIVRAGSEEMRTISDSEGNFKLEAPEGALVLQVNGRNIVAVEIKIGAGGPAENLRIVIEYTVPQIHESLVITASQLDPAIDRRNGTVYRDSLFSRDDQVFHTLDAGINAGQHEGDGTLPGRLLRQLPLVSRL